MEYLIIAKPIEWVPSGDDQFWDEKAYGFSIGYDPGEADGRQYHASWGESPENSFATLEEAQQWCQDNADQWVRDNVTVTPNI